MKNLKELQEKYSKYFNGLGKVSWGRKSYYEINSDKPLNLNSYGGNKGFVLNELGQVELWEHKEHYNYTYFYKGQEISEEEFNRLDGGGASSDDLELKTDFSKKWWGLTLDQYYPHPYYPEKKIKAFRVINNIPFLEEGEVYELFCGEIKVRYDIVYSEDDCLNYPEFFKPIYE